MRRGRDALESAAGGVVTLLTDFGTADGYVGEMKGVLLERAPRARLVDVSHAVARGDVRAGAWALWRVWARFPVGTVHLVVVDPGVGSDRAAVAVRVAGRWFVGPDNGLLTRVLADGGAGAAGAAGAAGTSGAGAAAGAAAAPGAVSRSAIQELRVLEPGRIGLRPLSDTFHGRDLFAPAAAHLAAGRDPEGLGPPGDRERLVRLEAPPPERPGAGGGRIRGRVVHVDRFGNLVTDVPADWLPERPEVQVGGRRVVGLSRSFDEVPVGAPLLTRGSVGTLEISVRDGSAAELLSAGRGAEVTVRPARS